MTRIEWYRYLRSGWLPMAARFAWTQALIYEGKSVEGVYAWPATDRGSQVGIAKLTIANYAAGAFDSLRKQKPFWDILAGRR